MAAKRQMLTGVPWLAFGGAKYVFVSKGKVFDIENQNLAGLEDHAAHAVKLTGNLQADKKTIKASKITMAMAIKKKSKPA